MTNQYHSLTKNQTRDLIPRLQGKNMVKRCWVYTTKFTSRGSIERHKPHLVVKGFYQK